METVKLTWKRISLPLRSAAPAYESESILLVSWKGRKYKHPSWTKLPSVTVIEESPWFFNYVSPCGQYSCNWEMWIIRPPYSITSSPLFMNWTLNLNFFNINNKMAFIACVLIIIEFLQNYIPLNHYVLCRSGKCLSYMNKRYTTIEPTLYLLNRYSLILNVHNQNL